MDDRIRQRLISRVEGTAAEAPLRRISASLEPAAAKRNRAEHQRLHLLFAWCLGKADGCVDVGANRGIVLQEMVRLAPEGHHVAFEPVPDLHSELVRRFPKVDVRCAAASSHSGEAEFTHVPSMPGFSRLGTVQAVHGHAGTHLRVRTEALDEALPADYVPAVIKIDTEGADRAVIEGAVRTISTHKPMVIFEHSAEAGAGDDGESDRIVALLCEQCGLRIFDLDGNGPYDARDLRRAYAARRQFNFVAHS